MSARPYLRKPKLNSAPKVSYDRDFYSARNQFSSIRKESEGGHLTSDDVVDLKREKQRLLHEQSILKAKIGRFQSLARKEKLAPAVKEAQSAPKRTKQIANSLEKHVKTLNQLAEEKRATIFEIINSEQAAKISELQEESKVFELEIYRLREIKREVESQYKELENQLEIANKKYSVDSLNKQKTDLNALKKELNNEKKKSEQLKQELESLQKAKQAEEERPEHQDLIKQIKELKAQIKEEQKTIKSLDQQVSEMSSKQSQEINNLQE